MKLQLAVPRGMLLALPLSILNQPQEAPGAGRVRRIGNKLLPEQRIPHVAHVDHEFVEDILRQPITEAADQIAYRAHCMKFASKLHLRLG